MVIREVNLASSGRDFVAQLTVNLVCFGGVIGVSQMQLCFAFADVFGVIL